MAKSHFMAASEVKADSQLVVYKRETKNAFQERVNEGVWAEVADGVLVQSTFNKPVRIQNTKTGEHKELPHAQVDAIVVLDEKSFATISKSKIIRWNSQTFAQEREFPFFKSFQNNPQSVVVGAQKIPGTNYLMGIVNTGEKDLLGGEIITPTIWFFNADEKEGGAGRLYNAEFLKFKPQNLVMLPGKEGHFLLVGEKDIAVCKIDMATRNISLLNTIHSDNDIIRNIQVSADGRFWAASSPSGLLVWEVEDNVKIKSRILKKPEGRNPCWKGNKLIYREGGSIYQFDPETLGHSELGKYDDAGKWRWVVSRSTKASDGFFVVKENGLIDLYQPAEGEERKLVGEATSLNSIAILDLIQQYAARRGEEFPLSLAIRNWMSRSLQIQFVNLDTDCRLGYAKFKPTGALVEPESKLQKAAARKVSADMFAYHQIVFALNESFILKKEFLKYLIAELEKLQEVSAKSLQVSIENVRKLGLLYNKPLKQSVEVQESNIGQVQKDLDQLLNDLVDVRKSVRPKTA
jgi:hypothetical protein